MNILAFQSIGYAYAAVPQEGRTLGAFFGHGLAYRTKLRSDARHISVAGRRTGAQHNHIGFVTAFYAAVNSFGGHHHTL